MHLAPYLSLHPGSVNTISVHVQMTHPNSSNTWHFYSLTPSPPFLFSSNAPHQPPSPLVIILASSPLIKHHLSAHLTQTAHPKAPSLLLHGNFQIRSHCFLIHYPPQVPMFLSPQITFWDPSLHSMPANLSPPPLSLPCAHLFKPQLRSNASIHPLHTSTQVADSCWSRTHNCVNWSHPKFTMPTSFQRASPGLPR